MLVMNTIVLIMGSFSNMTGFLVFVLIMFYVVYMSMWLGDLFNSFNK